jgi:hypothetical protein
VRKLRVANKVSNKALLASVAREMAQPRVTHSAKADAGKHSGVTGKQPASAKVRHTGRGR